MQHMPTGDSRNRDKPVKRQLCLRPQLYLYFNKPLQHLHYCRHNPLVNLLLHSSLTPQLLPNLEQVVGCFSSDVAGKLNGQSVSEQHYS